MAARQALVKDAMVHLKKRKGATLAQIQQQLESSYAGKVDVKNKKMLTTALKGLVKKGQVEKQGGNYKLARVAKLSNTEKEEESVPSRHHRRRHHGGGSSRRRRHHKSRHHHSRRRRHHSRRHKHHSRRRSKRHRRR